MPIQFRGPWPNAIKAIGCRFVANLKNGTLLVQRKDQWLPGYAIFTSKDRTGWDRQGPERTDAKFMLAKLDYSETKITHPKLRVIVNAHYVDDHGDIFGYINSIDCGPLYASSSASAIQWEQVSDQDEPIDQESGLVDKLTGVRSGTFSASLWWTCRDTRASECSHNPAWSEDLEKLGVHWSKQTSFEWTYWWVERIMILDFLKEPFLFLLMDS